MNRRGFIGSLVGGIATAAAVRTWPFRVYSFPTQPKLWIYGPLPDEVFQYSPIITDNSGYFLGRDLWMFNDKLIKLSKPITNPFSHRIGEGITA